MKQRQYDGTHYHPAYMEPEVMDTCLHCQHKRCLDELFGCEDYKAAERLVKEKNKARREGRPRRARKGKRRGKGNDSPGNNPEPDHADRQAGGSVLGR